MTVNALLLKTLSLMGADYDEATDYADKFFDTMNILLAENFNLNNAIRNFRGLEPLEDIPQYTNLNQELTYDTQFLTAILPYGIAGNLLLADNSNVLGDKRIQKYEYEREHMNLVKYVPVRDVYREGY